MTALITRAVVVGAPVGAAAIMAAAVGAPTPPSTPLRAASVEEPLNQSPTRAGISSRTPQEDGRHTANQSPNCPPKGAVPPPPLFPSFILSLHQSGAGMKS